MPERVDHTATWNTRLEPFVERRSGRVGITLGLVAVFWEGKLMALLTTCFAAQSDVPTSGICLELEPVFSRRH